MDDEKPKVAHIQRWPQTRDELWEFVYTIWGVRIARKAVCPGHCAPFDAFADAYFAVHNVTVWWASRGLGGKSMSLAHLALTEAVALKASVTVLGGSGEQSTNVLNYITNAWHLPYAPKELLEGDPAKREIHLKYKNTIRALMASQTSVRGPHPERLRLDEADEMDKDIFLASLGQPISRNGIESQTVISSTRQYADGTMDFVLKEAAKKNWPVKIWCYRESLEPNGWLSLKELEKTRNRIPEAMWEAEYELQEPSSETRAINTHAVERMYDPSLGEVPGELEYHEFEAPRPGEQYFTGADWAKDVDWTIISTWKAISDTKWQCVAWERLGRKPWPLMVARFNERLFRYRGRACHDITGVGKVIDDYIIVPPGSSCEGIWLAGKERADSFSDYISSIESDRFISPRITFAFGEHKYVQNGDLYATGGHPPDSFIANCMAWKSRLLNASFGGALSIVQNYASSYNDDLIDVDPRGV